MDGGVNEEVDVVGAGTAGDPYVVSVDRPRCRVGRSSDQSIPPLVSTPIDWDTEVYDHGGMWSPGSSDRLVIPRDGLYVFHTRVSWYAIAGATWRFLALYINGDVTLPIDVDFQAADFNTQTLHCYGEYEMSAGQYVRAHTSHDDSVNSSIVADTDATPAFSARWVAPLA